MTKRLTMRELTDAVIAAERMPNVLELATQYYQLHEKVKVFEAVVWFPRLQEQVNAPGPRGMSGRCRDTRVMTWCCAGRCMIQLERKESRITLITADDQKPWSRDNAHVAPGMGPMGIQSIDSEFMDAMVMLYEVTRYGAEIDLVPDEKVTVG